MSHAVSSHSPDFRDLVEVSDAEAQPDNADNDHDGALARHGEALAELTNIVVGYSREHKAIYEVSEGRFFV